jgi:hypothetical protein
MIDFMKYWQFHDPITPLVRGRRKALLVTDVIPQKELVKTGFYNEVLTACGSYHGMSGRAFDGESEIGDVGIWRKKTGPNSPPEIACFLTPSFLISPMPCATYAFSPEPMVLKICGTQLLRN